MRRLFLYTLITLAVLPGCVSTKTYQAALDESKGRLDELQKTSSVLDAEKKANEKLRKELESLEDAKRKEVYDLKERIDDLVTRGVMTSKEIDDLKKEKDRLSASDKTRGEETGNLKTELARAKSDIDDRSKRLEELKKELERISASVKAAADENEALKKEAAAISKEREYLGREVERLKIKAGEISTEKEKELQNVKSTYENLVKELKKEIETGDIKITQAVDRLSVNLVEKILFDSGEADVKPEGLAVLKRVGGILKGIPDKQIRVEGHTDNVQIGAKIKKRYPTNWELSAARATNVVRFFQEKAGVDPKHLSVGGFSENKPVASNDTPEGRTQNRRIEIVLLPLDIDRVLEELKK